MSRTYFDLCNDVLEELYYERVETFEELDTIAEGRRVKKMLNQALSYICNNENEAWSFRNKSTQLILVPGMKEYNRPNGYIEYMKYTNQDIVLTYMENHKYLPNNCDGLPTSYYISNDMINLFPHPSEAEDNLIINIEYYTDDFAEDCCGLDKPKMTDACDTPIIPERHRDVLVWKVCADWRANDADAVFQHYQSKFKKAYKALKMDCARTMDRPQGFQIEGIYPNVSSAIYNAWQLRTQTSRGQM